MSTLSEPRRPRLLAHNRRLRHLKGLSLRNLVLGPETDDGMAGVRPSPSTDNASCDRDIAASSIISSNAAAWSHRGSNGKHRTSSLGSSSATRSRQLDALVNSSLADVFFSLHAAPAADPDPDPIYVSELIPRSANFNFQFFNLADCEASISRRSLVTVRIWARSPTQSRWLFVLDQTVDLRRLNLIGTLVDRRFPPNALVFHLDDGIYSLDFASTAAEPRQVPPTTTSSYNALIKLANLQNAIQDALGWQRSLAMQIDALLAKSPPCAAELAQEHVGLANSYVAAQGRANAAAQRRRDELSASMRARRTAMARDREAQAQAEQDMAASRIQVDARRQLLDKTQQEIHGQRRRICADLSDMFPITPVPDAPPLSFRICNLPLPNSCYDAATARLINEDVLSAALGLVALVVRHLQFYLSYPLPYPIDAFGSRSFARDYISHLPDSSPASRTKPHASKPSPRRDFPLFLPRGGSTVGQWRFEYAWFLLNKDIEALCASQALRVVDIRHSLPNLKYLLYVGSAGAAEVPQRKRGGVKGLWAMQPLNSCASSSTCADGERNHEAPVKLPFADSDVRLCLRTRGLREDVAR
ncbi:hypothetical protein CDD82_4538 [Ophiocordyceps australis]|uniref:UV radiation resistance-associated gene protein n=1 Tax=Ophiocordyceps australis TaxID=1399860 RepID=A0A2C5Z2G9_9HYPO|nr:hypothetical protein CDD82_4538 [Ophiocordyceps australis]